LPRKAFTSNQSLMPARKAMEILAKQINDAAYVESEPFGSPKRDQWKETSQAALESAFPAGSSILNAFGTAQCIAFNMNDSDEELRHRANQTLSSMLAVLRSGVEQLKWKLEGEKDAGETEDTGAVRTGVLIFISHSSNDRDLAEALVDLLRGGLELSANRIRCSSVDGYRLPIGVNTESKLREEVNAAKVVVGLRCVNSSV
jgi:hypothetical protein